jgi:hypothetical protein
VPLLLDGTGATRLRYLEPVLRDHLVAFGG